MTTPIEAAKSLAREYGIETAPDWIREAVSKGPTEDDGPPLATVAKMALELARGGWPVNPIMGVLKVFAAQSKTIIPEAELRVIAHTACRVGAQRASDPELPEPQLSASLSGRLTFKWPDEGVIFEVDKLDRRRDGLHGEIGVLSEVDGGRRLWLHGPVRMNLSSTSAREALERVLSKRVSRAWGPRIDEVCRDAILWHDRGEEVMDLSQYPVGTSSDVWLLEPMLLDEAPTMLFGDGGCGKSTLAMTMAVGLATATQALPNTWPVAMANVGYFDWESTPDEHRVKLAQISNGLGLKSSPSIMYRKCVGPLVDQVDQLRRIISDHHIGLAIIDSVGLAAVHPLEDSESALGYFAALRSLGVATLSLGHVSKTADQQKPLGSAYWHNIPRITWEMRKSQEPGESHASLALLNRKSNRGKLSRPLGFRVDFTDTSVRYTEESILLDPVLSKNASVKAQIIGMMKQARIRLRSATIAKELDLPENVVTATLLRYRNVDFVMIGAGRDTEWGIKANGPEHESQGIKGRA